MPAQLCGCILFYRALVKKEPYFVGLFYGKSLILQIVLAAILKISPDDSLGR